MNHAMQMIAPLSDEESQILQNKFNLLCVSGDLEGIKEMWKQDRFDIPRRKEAKCSFNNLIIDKNTVLLAGADKKMSKWLENNRIDKVYV